MLFSSVTFVATLITASTAVMAQERFLIQQASRMAVDFFASNRAPGVPAAKASSEAGHIFDGVVSYPGFEKIAGEAIRGGGVSDKSQIAQYLSEGNAAYNSWSKGPSYAPFTKYFKEHMSDFDVDKILESGSELYSPYASRGKSMMAKFTADSQGKAIVSSAHSLEKHVASDLGVEKYLSRLPSP